MQIWALTYLTHFDTDRNLTVLEAVSHLPGLKGSHGEIWLRPPYAPVDVHPKGKDQSGMAK